jgi:hypothetical protein
VVINPPDGDMGAYLDALRMLEREHADLKWLAPGHGFLMDEPMLVVQGVIKHRLQREAKVVKALQVCAVPSTLAALVKHAYDDVHEGLHPLAQRSLLAHVLKLQAGGKVVVEGAAQDAGARWGLRGE